jgi:predicted NAD/FAD-binding protein
VNKKKVAVIGSGISGLTTAYLLSREHDVTVYEKNDYIGGHTATKTVSQDEKQYDVDTGFIVFNNKTYPNFLTLLDQLGVGKQETEMSFSVKNLLSGLEYNGHNLNTLFAQRRNIVKPSFYRLIKQILRFNKLAKQAYESNDLTVGQTLGDFLSQHQFDDEFADNYILPMGAAIWSTSLSEIKHCEVTFFIQFFFNHGLLNVNDRPQWYVIPGGSKNYIPPLIAPFKDNIVLNANIHYIERNSEGVQILVNDQLNQFDDVVIACHSVDALQLLRNPTALEIEILGGIPYSKNTVLLHTDNDILPKRKLAWAAWNYLLDGNTERPACVSYDMNILQGLNSRKHFCVTLNQDERVKNDSVLGTYNYEHPVFNATSVAMQKRRNEICGHNNTHFAGAYWYNGFHEDGVRSAVDVAARFGIAL